MTALPNLCIHNILNYLDTTLDQLNFLNSCNTLVNIKKLSMIISLDNNNSKLYFTDSNFYNIINKYNNIKLNIYNYDIPNIILGNNIIFIKIIYCKFNIEILKNVKNIELIKCDHNDLSILKESNKIIITECNNIFDISSLKNIPNLFITRCHNITNINILNNNILYLLDCNGISNLDYNNISNNINKIYIILCKNIKYNNLLKKCYKNIIFF